MAGGRRGAIMTGYSARRAELRLASEEVQLWLRM